VLPFLRIYFIPFVITAALFAFPAAAQISPGPLSRAHQQLEGVGKCASCHALGSNSKGFNCLECHAEIRKRIEAHTGMHSRAYKSASGQADCARCHMEHNGVAFVLTRIDRNGFDHAAQTGFTLVGKHREQKCENCHNSRKIAPAAKAEIKIKDLNHSFLGLRRECLGCHEDQHKGQLGTDCTHCHNQDAWKPASSFNHTSARFQLTGLHQNVACQKCHVPPPGEKTGPFKGLSFAACSSCHNDPHKGAFQAVLTRSACDTCHNTNGWKNNRPGGSFDHNTTKFALKGKHAELLCSKCHKTTDFHQPIAHNQCKDCHKDTHKGQFATRAAGSDCSSCHTENGYKPTRFDRETHKTSAFPLEGKHFELACSKCHLPEGADAVYKTGKLICSACHEDKHAKQFQSAPYENRCDQCHDATSFKPNTFSVDRHAKTQFPLVGKHATVECRDCHKPLADTRQFHFDSRTCNSCHNDPHETKLSCETCHTPENWKTTKSFDHVSTGFRLEGGHAKVEQCIKCHPAAKAPVSAAVSVAAKSTGGKPAPDAPVFGHTPKVCSKCHEAKDPHAGQFSAGGREEDCSFCHVTLRWSKEDFDHEKARYTLDRAHRNVACEKCHKTQKEIGAKMVRYYRGTPMECVQCH
jgi:hypothetical protein